MLGILACLVVGLVACGGSAGIAETIEIDAAAWDGVAPHLRLTVTPRLHQGMDRYAATFFSARVVLPDDESVEVARYRSYRKEDNSIMRGWLGGAGEQRVALKRVSLDDAALVRAKQLGVVVVHVDELRGDDVVVAEAHVARLGVEEVVAMLPGGPAAAASTTGAGDGTAAGSDAVDEIERLQSSVASAQELFEQREARVASARKRIVEEARVEALTESWALEGYLSNLEQVVSAEGADGSLMMLGWVVEKTKEVPALWEFTDDVKAFHSLCVGRFEARQERANAERQLHEYRLEHDADYAEELREQARQREEQALAAAQAEAAEAAARAESAREEAARAEVARAEALKAEAAREPATWLETVHTCDTLTKLGQLVARADALRGKYRTHWADAGVRAQAADALAGSLTRLAPREHEVLAEDVLPRAFEQSEGAPESQSWTGGVPSVAEPTITTALDVVRMIAGLEEEATIRTGLLDDRFWTAIQQTQRELAEEAAAQAAALAEAKARYHEQFLADTGAVDTVSAVNDLTRRVREGQSSESDYWDDADVSRYAKMQAQALRALLGGPLSPGPLGRPLQTLVEKWSYRNDRHVPERWRDACKAFPEGEAESILALLTDGCLLPDATTAFEVLPGITKDPAFWSEVVKARSTDD